DFHHVPIVGVILNKVLPDKKEMVWHYMQKALARWNIPLLGCIPYDDFLSNPTLMDYANLFNVKLLSGEEHKLRHFEHIRFIATSLEVYKTLIRPSQLVITPASREDIILETLTYHKDLEKNALLPGMILTGSLPPKDYLVEALKKANLPAFYVPLHTFHAMKMITSYIAKLRKEDTLRVEQTIAIVEQHIDFDRLLAATGILE
ncbi:MAG: cobyrinic acid a,c-diamide synthase, partial [Chlamydiae bacterium]|nr:cobyrinic acid a,c-diamide synthase [Chlamydiota bacterium]